LLTLCRNIHQDCRPHQPVERYLVDGLVSLGEMTRRVYMGAAMLGSREFVRGIVKTLIVDAILFLLEFEAVFGRPEDRVCVIGMRQINEFAARQIYYSSLARCRCRTGFGGLVLTGSLTGDQHH